MGSRVDPNGYSAQRGPNDVAQEYPDRVTATGTRTANRVMTPTRVFELKPCGTLVYDVNWLGFACRQELDPPVSRLPAAGRLSG